MGLAHPRKGWRNGRRSPPAISHNRLRSRDPRGNPKEVRRRRRGGAEPVVEKLSELRRIPVRPFVYVEEKNNEICLFWLLRQRQIRWHEGGRAKRHVRHML